MTSKGELIGNGQTSEVFLWDNNQAIKLYLSWCPANWAEKEFKALKILHDLGLPVPKAKEIIEYKGRKGIIFELIHGLSLKEGVLNKNLKLSEAAYYTAEMHVLLHNCISTQLPSQREMLVDMINSAENLENSSTNKIIRYLEQLPDYNVVCHGDLDTNNILLSSSGLVLIDWMQASRGNPIADIAMTILGISLYCMPKGKEEIMLPKDTSKYFNSLYLRKYIKNKPISLQDIDKWMLPVMSARLCYNIPKEVPKLLSNINNRMKVLA